MNELNEYTKQGVALRIYFLKTLGRLLFEERNKRRHTLGMMGRQTNITSKYIDKIECGICNRPRWTIIALLLKHYKKKLTITLTDVEAE